ncbi:MAG: anaerobic ribonucleoside-triphosphate reductase activating protein [Firmicutes bacterium]|nr:anaerobic ribonucleoside-triphosphate reductase activating protein [Bacillota bacterium]MBQ2042565.1 anaerobic ribonucleoside-triphosphate reductase activating protein [Bacillota bacterium]
MNIAGLQKLTLLDFPGRCAATIFTPGCNLRCPFCHNASLVDPEEMKKTLAENGLIDPEDVLAFLKERKGRLTGLAVTGGEPLMQPGILDFLKEVKNIGYAVKLDTNGTNPERLRALLSAGIVDYVAMDYKNCREKYALTAGVPETTGAILYENTRLSMSFIRQSGVEHEYRTTIVKELHTVDDVRKMAKELEGEEKYFLQNFTDSGDILRDGFTSCSKAELNEMLAAAREYVPGAQLRGV